MIDYKQLDVASLTIDDALNDPNFKKTRADVTRFCALNDSLWKSFPDFDDAEMLAYMRAMTAYYNTGLSPDYSAIQSTAVRLALRESIASHSARVDAAYLDSYKSFVRGKKRKQTD